MRTDDLIKAIAADRQPVMSFRVATFRTLPLSVLGLAVASLMTLGIRPDASDAGPVIAMKLAITLSLACTALAALPAIAAQGERRNVGLLWIAPLLTIGFAAGDLALNGADGAFLRMAGTKASHCVVLIPLLSTIPLAALLYAFRRGMPADPARAGALAGLAAAGIGASLYALNCTEDSPLFVAFWYTIAVLIVTVAGAGIGARLLRW